MMKRDGFAIALFALVGCVGCGSADSANKPRSMGEVGAALEKQAPAGAATTNSGGAAADSANAQAAPAAVDPSLPSKRGYALTDWSNEAAYVLVKADVGKTADALAAAWKGKVIKDIFGMKVDEDANQVVVYQLAGHPWSIFACDNGSLEELTPVLSRDADLLLFWNSDFNGWAGVQLHRGGQEIEAVHWGPEEDGLGEDADASKWHSEGKHTITHEDISFDETFRFRSKDRKATPEELAKGEAFVDAMFKHHDAYLPDVDQMPWFDYDTKVINSPLGKGAFAGVHAVEVGL